jgi:hypothetical protein
MEPYLRIVVLILLAGACRDSPREITGPFSGSTHTYFVRGMELPTGSAYSADLNHDGKGDNQLGAAIAAFGPRTDGTRLGRMVLGLADPALIEIISDDPRLVEDGSVGVRFLGRAGDGAALLGARLSSGALETNSVAITSGPTPCTLRLPLFKGVSPVVLSLTSLQIASAPQGGLTQMVLNGAVAEEGQEKLLDALLEAMRVDPQAFLDLYSYVDMDRDGLVTRAEAATRNIIVQYFRPDVQLFADGVFAPTTPNVNPDSWSLGIGLNLAACETPCVPQTEESCQDLAPNGQETGIDCGGPCRPCPAGEPCLMDTDCQSGRCDSQICGQPTCSDGILNGAERGVDCGHNCAPCGAGERCWVDLDCASGSCSALVGEGKCL